MIIDSFRADAARQKSEALRNLATQLIEEHKDYTKKNELVSLNTLVQFEWLIFCSDNESKELSQLIFFGGLSCVFLA